MKIRNNTLANLSICARSTRGAASKKYLTIIGESQLELDDDEWRDEYADSAKDQLEAGNIEITKAPKPTDEEQADADEAALAAAQKLVEDNTPKISEIKTTPKVDNKPSVPVVAKAADPVITKDK